MGTNWAMLPGQYVDAATIGADRYYGVGTDRQVYRWATGRWRVVGGDAKSVTAASDGTVAVINATLSTVWVKSGDDDTVRWTQAPGVYAKQIALVKRGSLYYVGLDGNVWRSDMVSAPVKVGRNVTAIAASASGTVTAVSVDGSVWRKNADDAVEAWTPLGVRAVSVATPNATRLVYTDTAGGIFAR